jgi:hypothetical protein
MDNLGLYYIMDCMGYPLVNQPRDGKSPSEKVNHLYMGNVA